MERESRHRSLFNDMTLLALFPYHQPCRRSGQLRHPPADLPRKNSVVRRGYIPVCVRHIGGVYHPRLVHSRHVPPGTARHHSNHRWFCGGAHSGYRMLVPALLIMAIRKRIRQPTSPLHLMALPLIAPAPGAIGEVIGLSARYTEPRERLAIPYRRIGDIPSSLWRCCAWCAHHWYAKLGPSGIPWGLRALWVLLSCASRRRTDDPRVNTLAIGL